MWLHIDFVATPSGKDLSVPVDLRVLPDPLELPRPPGMWRWGLLVLIGTVAGAGLAIWLWPAEQQEKAMWFWSCVVVFPLLAGLLLFALRRMVYERQYEFAQRWNRIRDEQELALIQSGQRAVGVLATSYRTGAGSRFLAQAICCGSKPLQPIYLAVFATTMRLSQLAPEATLYTVPEYRQRLLACFQQVMRGLAEDAGRLDATPVRVRFKHNQVLGDDEVFALWQQCGADTWMVEQVVFATVDDGLLWLDVWLDDPSPPPLVLSLEINLFLLPVAEQAESVSAVLLALPEWTQRKKSVPTAWVHRPAGMAGDACSLADVLCWGRVAAGADPFFAWQSQLQGEALSDISIAMQAAGHSLAADGCQCLDGSLGLPGSAVGNIALIVASEHAAAKNQVQLIMVQDASPHGCIVRPADGAVGGQS
jgi:hypothetical protein